MTSPVNKSVGFQGIIRGRVKSKINRKDLKAKILQADERIKHVKFCGFYGTPIILNFTQAEKVNLNEATINLLKPIIENAEIKLEEPDKNPASKKASAVGAIEALKKLTGMPEFVVIKSFTVRNNVDRHTLLFNTEEDKKKAIEVGKKNGMTVSPYAPKWLKRKELIKREKQKVARHWEAKCKSLQRQIEKLKEELYAVSGKTPTDKKKPNAPKAKQNPNSTRNNRSSNLKNNTERSTTGNESNTASNKKGTTQIAAPAPTSNIEQVENNKSNMSNVATPVAASKQPSNNTESASRGKKRTRKEANDPVDDPNVTPTTSPVSQSTKKGRYQKGDDDVSEEVTQMSDNE